MLNNLDLLIIVFIVLTILSIIGVVLQFAIRNQIIQKISFYFAAILGSVLCIFKYLSTPHTGFYTGQIVLGFALGVLAILAVVWQLTKKDDKAFLQARMMTAVSVIGGMICTFII